MDLTHMTRCQCHSATQEALSAEEPEPFLKDGGNTAQDCLKCFRRMSPSAIHTFLLTHRHLIISSPELGSPLPILTSMLLSSSSPQEIPHQPPRPEIWVSLGFPGGSDGKESAWNAGDLDLTPGSRRNSRRRLVGSATCRKTLISWSALDKNLKAGYLFEGNPVYEGKKQRGTDTPIFSF